MGKPRRDPGGNGQVVTGNWQPATGDRELATGNPKRASAAARPKLAVVLLALLFFALACQREAPVPLEPVLTAQLKSMRDGLSAYAKQQGRYPQSLDEMVSAGILKEIPVDPVTKSKTTWKLVREESVANDDFSTEGSAAPKNAPIVDIRSGASGADSRGIPWSEY